MQKHLFINKHIKKHLFGKDENVSIYCYMLG